MDKNNLIKNMVNAQEWLEQNYPQNGVCLIDDGTNQNEKREETTYLNLDGKQLEGVLNLTDFVNLDWLDCSENELTELILPNNKELKTLYCNSNQLTILTLPIDNQLETIFVYNNLLTSFEYHKLNPQTLKELNLSNNNLTKTDIEVFSDFINLTDLDISNDDYNVMDYVNCCLSSLPQKDKINKFWGSLESLKNCTKLEELNISNTNINRGLEYLPTDLKKFSCFSINWWIIKVKVLDEASKKNFKKWQTDHSHLINNAQIITELEQYEEVDQSIQQAFCPTVIKKIEEQENNNLIINTFCNPNQGFRLWLDEKTRQRSEIIEKLRTENERYYENIELNDDQSWYYRGMGYFKEW